MVAVIDLSALRVAWMLRVLLTMRTMVQQGVSQ
jgi:hypothetical protein